MIQNTVYNPEIRFADIDAMGHVNNAVYFTYFEQARMHFFKHVVGTAWDWNESGILVGHNEVDYLIPILLHDDVSISMTCSHIGTKSFTLNYEIKKRVNNEEILCSKGKSILICFHYKLKTTMAIPEEWRKAFESLIN